MSAVNLWKAQQLLLWQPPSVAFRKWRFVGNGESAASDHGPERRIKISSATLNRISASSPTPMHRSSRADFAEHNATEEPSRQQDREIPPRKKSPRASKTVRCVGARCNVGKRRSYCRVSIKRVMVRFRSLSDRRISSILLMECSTVV